jgi:hypothetical protein
MSTTPLTADSLCGLIEQPGIEPGYLLQLAGFQPSLQLTAPRLS